ncbi:MAG: glycogen debranching enzyme N-terminal domain-containing protein, partial [Ktedonobacteraceae bacterium]
MSISFERNICCNFDETITREWFLTNGLGGYASGTIAGTLTRMQHGLLVAALPEDTTPQLLLAKIDEEILFDQRTFYLGTNEYRDGTLNPAGFVHLESFRLEDSLPIFTYRLGGIDGITLEKRIWMLHGQNTTYIQYRVLRTSPPQLEIENFAWRSSSRTGANTYARSHNYMEATQPSLTLTLLPFVAHRSYDQPQYGGSDGQFQVHTYEAGLHMDALLPLARGMAGCTICAKDKATPYHILASSDPTSAPQFIPTGVWYWHFLRRHDQAAGLPSTDDLYLPGVIRARLSPNQALTIIVTAEEPMPQFFEPRHINQCYEQALNHQRSLLAAQSYFGEGGGTIQTLPVLPLTTSAQTRIGSEEFLQLLHQAGDHFIIQRTLPSQERTGTPDFFFHAAKHIATILPSYYAYADQTREALIALPGLTITTRRYSDAQCVLRALARHFRQGLLPDRLPTAQQPRLEDGDYGSVDTPLWYCYALDKYLGATRDYELLDELYPCLVESFTCYIQGTLHGIQLDPTDGLLRTNAPARALTWMNALDQGVPVTPRTGKAVEVNALWYHALALMQEWSHMLYQRGRTNYIPQQYEELRAICSHNFNARFWHQEGDYLYDVIDGPTGHDARLRPNQLLA